MGVGNKLIMSDAAQSQKQNIEGVAHSNHNSYAGMCNHAGHTKPLNHTVPIPLPQMISTCSRQVHQCDVTKTERFMNVTSQTNDVV